MTSENFSKKHKWGHKAVDFSIAGLKVSYSRVGCIHNKRHSFKSCWCVWSVRCLVGAVSVTRQQMRVPENYLEIHCGRFKTRVSWSKTSTPTHTHKKLYLVNSSTGNASIPLNTSPALPVDASNVSVQFSVSFLGSASSSYDPGRVCERRSRDSSPSAVSPQESRFSR